MPDRSTKDTAPKLYSRDWWELRKDVLADIATHQARLKKSFPLVDDRDPALQRLLQDRSDAAMTLSLYASDPRSDLAALCGRYDEACQAIDRYRASRA